MQASTIIINQIIWALNRLWGKKESFYLASNITNPNLRDQGLSIV